jgi:hypothetical protein
MPVSSPWTEKTTMSYILDSENFECYETISFPFLYYLTSDKLWQLQSDFDLLFAHLAKIKFKYQCDNYTIRMTHYIAPGNFWNLKWLTQQRLKKIIIQNYRYRYSEILEPPLFSYRYLTKFYSEYNAYRYSIIQCWASWYFFGCDSSWSKIMAPPLAPTIFFKLIFFKMQHLSWV